MRFRSLWCALALLPAVFAGASAHAANRFVAPCGQDFWTGLNPNCLAPHGPKRTIQAAIDASSDGDTIFVLPGTYFGTIDLDGKAITVIGTGGAALTILDANGAGPAVVCNSFEGPDTVIEGLTIRDGFTTGSGAGMLIALASPTITGCVFESNEARVNGGAISCTLASPTITDCTFTQNEADNAGFNASNGNGGAISITGGNPVVTGCTFIGNAARFRGGHVYMTNSASPVFEDCHFELGVQLTACPADPDCTTSMGSAVAALNSAPEFQSCTFHDNRFGGRGTLAVSAGSVSLVGCTFSLNRPFNFADPNIHGGALFLAAGAAAELTGCNFQDNYSNSSAGAVRIVGSSLVATLCGFSGNEAADGSGGAIDSIDSDIVLSACTLSSNQARDAGGAIRAEGGSLALEGCALTFNTATGSKGASAGALQLVGTQTLASACTFENNSSTTFSGAIWWLPRAGGPEPEAQEFNLGLLNCDFVDNAGYFGGAITMSGGVLRAFGGSFQDNHMPGPSFGYGAAAHIDEAASARFENVQFTGNSANFGGALSIDGAAEVIGCAFIGNSADNGGAAGVRHGGSAMFVSCAMEGNAATVQGAAIKLETDGSATVVNTVVRTNTAPLGQGAIANGAGSDGTLAVINSAIISNIGGGIRNDHAAAEVTVANSIVRSNVSGGQLLGWSPTVRFSNIQGGAIGQGVIDADPMFVNPAVGNYRLQPGSPCIDAGHNWALPQDAPDLDLDGNLAELIPVDFDGNPRFADNPAAFNAGCGSATVVDIGPFETLGATGPDLVPGDTDEDGSVNFNDIVTVLANWGACLTPCCPGDVDGSGAVDFNDLVIILGNWS